MVRQHLIVGMYVETVHLTVKIRVCERGERERERERERGRDILSMSPVTAKPHTWHCNLKVLPSPHRLGTKP
jgi:hypothetical protein